MADEKIETLIQETRAKIDRAFANLEDGLSRKEAQVQATAESSPTAGKTDVSDLLSFTRKFSAAHTQVETLSLLVELASNYAPRALLLIRKGSNVHGWAGSGFSPDFMDKNLKKLKWSIDTFPELTRVIHQHKPLISNFSDLSDLSEEITDFDGFMPFKSCFFPITVKNKVAAILYTDSGTDTGIGDTAFVEILCYIAGLELTMVTSKLKPAKGDVPDKDPPSPPVQPNPPPALTIPEIEPSERIKHDPIQERAGVLAESDGGSVKKAKRVARVLVSDLKLYNEQAVMQGLRQKNLYSVLQDDLDRSYKHYQERVSGLVISTDVNYFKEELIRQLGEGNPDAIGPLPF